MKGLAVLVAGLVVMLFVGGPEAGDSRLIQAMWNLGHVPLFAGLALLGCATPLARQLAGIRLFLAATVLALLAGIAVEWLQLLIGRSFDYLDVLRDLAGVYLGLGVHLARQSRSWQQRLGFLGMSSLLLLLALLPIGQILVDSYAMQRAFPVLSDFESARELSRWETQRAAIALADEPVRHGGQSLRVTFQAGRFPDVGLREMQSDWSAYQTLHVSTFNTLSTPLDMTVKIFDREHMAGGYHSKDRFNQVVSLRPGWNDLHIALADVKKSPADRAMDMANIAGLSFFLPATDQSVVIYLDAIGLGND
ncbi:MAG: VanZ family protein [Gammaproteobacteria bacterium]|jgi:VanZ family protein|nr:VanZ family protein [Gammaproteobacteria bacterium]